jgi:hypothetical protein
MTGGRDRGRKEASWMRERKLDERGGEGIYYLWV